jgi:hypothetical protein
MYGVVGTVWCAVTLGLVVWVASYGSPFALIFGAMFIFGAVMIWRTVTMVIIGDEEALIARGWLQRLSLPRSEIEGFRVGKLRASSCVFVIVRGSGSVPLEATTLPIPRGLVDETWITDDLRQLNAWLAIDV